MTTLTNGFYFDLGVIVLVAVVVACWLIWRHFIPTGQHLAEPDAVRVPIETHEGDWDWPRRSEHNNRLLRSGQ